MIQITSELVSMVHGLRPVNQIRTINSIVHLTVRNFLSKLLCSNRETEQHQRMRE